ncbi:MAG: hypothetical protein JKY56_19940 [Kofleriaceae bacterium]|nr:hypothetical protein [Kofleriaceae bacterium]
MKTLRIALPALLLLACTTAESPIPPDDTPKVVDLRAAIGSSDVDVVGITISPDTQKRYALDSERGIYEMSDDGTLSLVLALEAFPSADESIQSEFTDIAAMGNNRFALTALNEGYMLDLNANTLLRHFCYLPDDLEDTGVYQMTHSVTFDAETGLIYAQPQTFSELDNRVVASSIGRFAEGNGAEQQWYALPESSFVAGALSVNSDGNLLLGNGPHLSVFDLSTQTMGASLSLRSYGIRDIKGMAIDEAADELLIVDGDSDKLVVLPLSVISEL